jgi:hypothetical protein
MNESPLLSRPANPDRQYVEIRPVVPVDVVAVIDAICIERKIDRTKLVCEWLRERAAAEHRKASLIVKLTGVNPNGLESDD